MIQNGQMTTCTSQTDWDTYDNRHWENECSPEIMRIWMDLFNVFKRYAQFGEQTNQRAYIASELIKWPTSLHMCLPIKQKRENRINTLYSCRSMHMHTHICCSTKTPQSVHCTLLVDNRTMIKFIASYSVNRYVSPSPPHLSVILLLVRQFNLISSWPEDIPIHL